MFSSIKRLRGHLEARAGGVSSSAPLLLLLLRLSPGGRLSPTDVDAQTRATSDRAPSSLASTPPPSFLPFPHGTASSVVVRRDVLLHRCGVRGKRDAAQRARGGADRSRGSVRALPAERVRQAPRGNHGGVLPHAAHGQGPSEGNHAPGGGRVGFVFSLFFCPVCINHTRAKPSAATQTTTTDLAGPGDRA